jgi:hypothetical protein
VEDQEAICIVIGDVEQRDALHVWVNPRFIATAMAGGDDDEIVPAHLRKRIA